MGAERGVRWGPPALAQVVADQLERHGLGSTDAAACARELAAAVGPAARASSFVDLGGCRFLEGDVAGAIAAWQQAIVSGQTAPAARALFNLGLLHEHLGLHVEASQRLEAAAAHGVAPYAGLANLARARAMHRAGDDDRAMATLARMVDRLVETGSDHALLGQALVGLGDVAESAGDTDRAEHAYRAALASGDAAVRTLALPSLVRVLRFIGHDDEAQQVVEESGLEVADPAMVLDRLELLVRLGRLNEAEDLLDDLVIDDLGVADRFRVTTMQIDLGMVNEAIDELERLAGEGLAAETRARAAYQLGSVYRSHDMAGPAAAMFSNVRQLQPGYWADKASLMLGDLAMADGRHRIAAAHWADAAASRIDSVSVAARERLVAAVDTTPAAIDMPSSELSPIVAPVVVEPIGESEVGRPEVAQPEVGEPEVIEVQADEGPVTEAVEMVTLLDDEPLDTPGEITPVAGVLMELPDAAPIEVVIPAEPLTSSSDIESALPDEGDPVVASPAESAPAAPPVEEPAAAAPPASPTVIPLRRRSAAVDHTDSAPSDESPELDVPYVAPNDAEGSAGRMAVLDRSRTADEPVVVPLARETKEPVIDLRDDAAEGNPYAALAPEVLSDDPRPSERNPYAELAPNYSSDPVDLRSSGDDDPGPSTFSRFA